MTTNTDKPSDRLVEMAQKCGARPTKTDHVAGTLRTEVTRLEFTVPQLAAFASAHIASLCGDVEPVAHMYPSDLAEFERKEMVAEAVSVSCTSVVTHERTVPLYSASTVAALKARVAELEKDAARLDYLQRGSTVELLPPFPGFRFRIGGLLAAVHADIRSAIDAALKKGQQ